MMFKAWMLAGAVARLRARNAPLDGLFDPGARNHRFSGS